MALTADPTTPRAAHRQSPPPRSSSSGSSGQLGNSASLSRSSSASQGALAAPPRRSPSPPLSSDVPTLHAQLRTLRAELATLRSAHDALLSRSAELADQQYAGSSSSGSVYGSPPGASAATQARVRELEAALAQERARREEEEAKVMDLRIRGEESRRAIMRFQTEAAGAAQANNRRSMGPAALASWNPAVLPNVSPQPGAAGAEEDEEAQARRKSKRASLAFGPTARADILAAGRATAMGHRRTASGGGGTPDDGAPGAGGLRELRLGGTAAVPITLASEAAPAPSSASRRGSSHSMLSPQGSHAELAPDDASPGESLFGMRHALSRARRGTAGSEGSEGAMGLAPPGRNGSVSPSPSSMTSPILEDDDENGAATFPDNLSVHSDAPPTARPMSFLGMHPAGGPGPRALAEAEGKLRAREAELERARKEMRRLGSALDEAREAREASEVCLRALRHFIEEQAAASGSAGGAHGEAGADALKLPPLPTDLSAEDEEAVRSPGRKNSNNATWGARLGSTFMRAAAVTPSAAAANGDSSAAAAATSSTVRGSPGSADGASVPAPPSRSLASMFSRAYSGDSNASNAAGDEKATRQAGGMPAPASEFGASVDNVGSPETEAAAPAVPAAAAAAGTPLRGLSSWFSKRSSVLPTGAESVAASASSDNFTPAPTSKRQSVVASPPFASLDHSQLSRVPISPPAAAVTTSSPPTASANLSDKLQPAPPLLPPRIEPGERARRSASRTSSVAEDDGFVGPAFT